MGFVLSIKKLISHVHTALEHSCANPYFSTTPEVAGCPLQ